jgi:hypothetical protein
LVLLRAGFAVPPLLPETRCALAAPFHPYREEKKTKRSKSQEAKMQMPKFPFHFELLIFWFFGFFLFPAVSFLWHFPLRCRTRPLAGALPYGVRTFLSDACASPRSPGGLEKSLLEGGQRPPLGLLFRDE